jgi:hypothetical protein
MTIVDSPFGSKAEMLRGSAQPLRGLDPILRSGGGGGLFWKIGTRMGPLPQLEVVVTPATVRATERLTLDAMRRLAASGYPARSVEQR